MQVSQEIATVSDTDEKILKFLLDDPIATAEAMLDILRRESGDGPNPVREELYQRLYRWYAEQISDMTGV